MILLVYLGLTALGGVALWTAGMTPFEAINHSMSLISTGGFSTSDASLGHWAQPAVHWVAVVIMILGSLPFTLYVATLRGHRRILLKDHQVRGFLGFLVFVWLTVGTWLCWAQRPVLVGCVSYRCGQCDLGGDHHGRCRG